MGPCGTVRGVVCSELDPLSGVCKLCAVGSWSWVVLVVGGWWRWWWWWWGGGGGGGGGNV